MAKTFLSDVPDNGFWSALDDVGDEHTGEDHPERGYSSPHSGPLGEMSQFPAFTRRATVLVVDDESSIAEMIGEVLDSAGYRVLQAGNGRAALAIACQEHPALVLTDRMMPEIDGIEFVRLLYNTSATRDIPVVIMSSTRPSERRGTDNAVCHARALDRLATKHIPGVSTVVVAESQVGFLEKPFDIDALVDLVDTITTEEKDVAPLSH